MQEDLMRALSTLQMHKEKLPKEAKEKLEELGKHMVGEYKNNSEPCACDSSFFPGVVWPANETGDDQTKAWIELCPDCEKFSEEWAASVALSRGMGLPPARQDASGECYIPIPLSEALEIKEHYWEYRWVVTRPRWSEISSSVAKLSGFRMRSFPLNEREQLVQILGKVPDVVIELLETNGKRYQAK